jgi:predicted nucleic acid-binding protein
VARVALDADVVIAFLDAAADQHQRAVSVLRPRLSAGEEIVLSASVYAEIMVRPIARRTDAKVDGFLDAINATVIPTDRPTARLAAELRGRHRSLRLPDALSLAAAIDADAELLTLDTRLVRIQEREKKTA